jgi:hypothetical protein
MCEIGQPIMMLVGGAHNFLLCAVVASLILTSETEALTFSHCKVDTKDRVFFPDQLEYLQMWTSRCACDGLIYWPPHDKCYEEMTRGPCSVGRVLVFDRTEIQPRCDISSKH